MDYLPISVRVAGQWGLVVGGGEVAARKAALLARAGARLRVVAPVVHSDMAEVLAVSSHELRERPYHAADLDGARLAIAASDDDTVNLQVSRDAQTRDIPVNVVDAPELCTFIVPSVVDRDPLLIAVSTAGASPVLSRSTRADLEARLPARLGDLARLLGNHREQVKSRFATVIERRAFWEQILESEVAQLAVEGRLAAAEAKLIEALSGASPAVGSVHLVGVGPGDPDQVTLLAHRSMQRAEVIYCTKDVPDAVLGLARRDATRRTLGARGAPADDEELCAALLAGARKGHRVCWLARGALGEREHRIAQLLRAEGVMVVEVPGLPVDP
ncbi:MAG: SAM-dependent methyltransferase, partial [Myxococcales bacterium]|nr:SAM-dependent methyltransferase [Myxococcales bacterium]